MPNYPWSDTIQFIPRQIPGANDIFMGLKSGLNAQYNWPLGWPVIPVNYATTAALTATYANGASGVGATLTEVGNGALSVDGASPTAGQYILVKDQASQLQNGVYIVTDAGSGGTPYILTRATGFDSAYQMVQGVIVSIMSGTVNSSSSYFLQSTIATVGTDNLVFVLLLPHMINDGTMGTATSTNISSSSAIKTYVDNTFISIPAGSAGQVLRYNGALWVASTSLFADTYTASQLLYSNGANNIAGLATANSSILSTTVAGVPVWSSSLSDGQLLIGVTGGTPITGTLTAGTGISISNGAGSISISTTGAVVTPAALTRVDDTNVTLTLGGTPATAVLQATSITAGWTGQLSLTRGGTAASLTASNGGIVYSNATTLAILAGTATAGRVLQSGASAAPTWSTPTYPSASGSVGTILRSDGTNNIYSTSTFADTYAASTLLYSNGANTVTGLATANSAVLRTNATGVPGWSASMTNGQLIIGSTGATPTAATLTAGSGISITNGAASITVAATGALKSFQIFTSGTAQTYTKPAGITSILVEVLGGGGGGGGVAAAGAGTSVFAGGGASGGYARLWIASANSTYTYTVGAAGTGGAAGANNGNNGSTTSFGASLQATGGNGGTGGTGSASAATLNGGTAGTGSNGDINSGGSPGGDGFSINAVGGVGISGGGGDSIYGGGGKSVVSSSAVGNGAANYGSGGSGAATGAATNRAGGDGSAGLIVVWEFS